MYSSVIKSTIFLIAFISIQDQYVEGFFKFNLNVKEKISKKLKLKSAVKQFIKKSMTEMTTVSLFINILYEAIILFNFRYFLLIAFV